MALPCYYDAQVFSPERLALENVLDAVAHGAVAGNHAEVAAPTYAGDQLLPPIITAEETVFRSQ